MTQKSTGKFEPLIYDENNLIETRRDFFNLRDPEIRDYERYVGGVDYKLTDEETIEYRELDLLQSVRNKNIFGSDNLARHNFPFQIKKEGEKLLLLPSKTSKNQNDNYTSMEGSSIYTTLTTEDSLDLNDEKYDLGKWKKRINNSATGRKKLYTNNSMCDFSLQKRPQEHERFVKIDGLEKRVQLNDKGVGALREARLYSELERKIPYGNSTLENQGLPFEVNSEGQLAISLKTKQQQTNWRLMKDSDLGKVCKQFGYLPNTYGNVSVQYGRIGNDATLTFHKKDQCPSLEEAIKKTQEGKNSLPNTLPTTLRTTSDTNKSPSSTPPKKPEEKPKKQCSIM